MAGAFDGLRVVDFTQRTAGPYASMLLAEQGADVIKVEPPGGDVGRGSATFHVLNRGKRSAVLDLTLAADRRRAQDLAAAADVVLVDLLPEQAEAMGIDDATLRERNPDLVYCALPLYGSRGPWAHLPPDDTLAAAVSGVLGVQWSYEEAPVYLVIPLVAYATGILAAGAVAATLFDRARSGRGDYLEVSGLGGAFALQSSSYIAPLSGMEIVRLAGRGNPRGPFPTYRVYKAADGEWLMLGALTPVFWTKLALTLGLEEYLADPRFEGAPIAIPVPEDQQELSDRLAEIFATQPREHWLAALREADIPAAPVLSRDDFLRDPQTVHNQMTVEIDDPEVGPTTQMNVVVRLEGSAIGGPAPLLGQHSEEVFSELERRPSRRPCASGKRPAAAAPLDGVTVLDLGTIYAGPFGAMLLSDLGADVIKVEPLDGDPWRGFAFGFLGANRGKRGLAIDLKREEGREVFYDLARKADVVADNFRVGVLQRLKIDYATLSRLHPRVISCSTTPYGSSGPMAGWPGFDPLLLARSGLMRAQGGEGEEPVYFQIAVSDFTSGLLQAFGVVVALYAREHSGRGQPVESSLANGAMAAQIGEFVRYPGRPPVPPGGSNLLGRNALYRSYQCADGWLFLAVSTVEQAESLISAAGDALAPLVAAGAGSLLGAPLQGEVASALERFFAPRELRPTVLALAEKGVPCAPCPIMGDVYDDDHLQANDLWWDTEHPVNGPIRQTGRIVKWQRRAMRLERPAPLLGQHTREVLVEFGVSPERVEELAAAGVILVPETEEQQALERKTEGR